MLTTSVVYFNPFTIYIFFFFYVFFQIKQILYFHFLFKNSTNFYQSCQDRHKHDRTSSAPEQWRCVPPCTPHLRPTRALKSTKETRGDSSIKSQEASWWTINTSPSSPHRLLVSIQQLCFPRRKTSRTFQTLRENQLLHSIGAFLSVVSSSWGCVGERIMFDIRHRRKPRGEKVAAN